MIFLNITPDFCQNPLLSSDFTIENIFYIDGWLGKKFL